jgi:hypothetical protein
VKVIGEEETVAASLATTIKEILWEVHLNGAQVQET